MRVLVCGGRDFGEIPKWCGPAELPRFRAKAISEVRLLRDTLDEITIDRKLKVLIHGACRTGADRHADYWAGMSMRPVEAYPAIWYPDGKLDRSAGPRRNQRMIDEGKPDLVLAFPGGRGTADMVRRARAAGIEVREVPFPTQERA